MAGGVTGQDVGYVQIDVLPLEAFHASHFALLAGETAGLSSWPP